MQLATNTSVRTFPDNILREKSLTKGTSVVFFHPTPTEITFRLPINASTLHLIELQALLQPLFLLTNRHTQQTLFNSASKSSTLATTDKAGQNAVRWHH